MKLSDETWRAIDLLRDQPCRGMHRYDLASELGVPPGELWPILGPAYGAKLIDFCRDYVVLSAIRRR